MDTFLKVFSFLFLLLLAWVLGFRMFNLLFERYLSEINDSIVLLFFLFVIVVYIISSIDYRIFGFTKDSIDPQGQA